VIDQESETVPDISEAGPLDNNLKSALKRVSEGSLDQKDISLVQVAISSRRIAIASDGGVAIAGDAIGNIFVSLDAEAIRRLRPTIPNEIHPAPRDFIGREDTIKELREYFELGATVVGIRGLAGIGKTALAYKLAEELKDRYPDGQIMVDLRGTSMYPMKPAEAMAHIIRSFDPTFVLPENESELNKKYLSILNGRHALLLLDNAADDRQVRPLLPPSTCSLLITSSKKFTLPGLKEKDLDALTPSEAKKLLLVITRRIGDHADELAKLCGYLPLALRAAGSLLANSLDLSPAEYIEELRAEHTRLKGIGSDGIDLDVETSLNLSYGQLPEDTARVFRMLSVFPVGFDAKAEKAICEDEDHHHLSELVKWSLVDYRSLDGAGRYRLHDLARIFAANHLADDGDKACFEVYLRYAEHYENVLSNADDLYIKGGDNVLAGLKLFDLEWPNIRTGQAWAEKIAREDRVKKDSLEKENVLRLCSSYPLDGIYVIELRLHPREQVRWLETALDATRKLKDRGNEGAVLGSLGFAYFSLGEYHKAIEFHKQALIINRETGDRREEGQDLGNLGIAYHNLGEYHKAIEFHKQALAIDRGIGDRRREGQDLGNLGIAYYRLGEYHKAIEFHKQALAIDREIGDRLGEGQDLGNLGIAYYSLGEHRKAIEFQKQRLTIAMEIGDRLGEGQALWNKSLALDEIGERAQAIACAKSALHIYEQIGTPEAESIRRQLAKWQD
jgi:tetratricopeptide (TPR) repeat protein